MTISIRTLATALAMITAAPALATPSFYTDKASFLAAAGPVTLNDFSAPDQLFQVSTAYARTVDYGDFTVFSGLFERTTVIGVPGFEAAGVYRLGFFNLPHAVTAFGFDVLGAASAFPPLSVDLTLYAAGQAFAQTIFWQAGNDATSRFVGVIDPVGMWTVAVTDDDGGDFIALDNAVIGGSPATVPEPASWALMIGGFGMIGGTLRGYRGRGSRRTAQGRAAA